MNLSPDNTPQLPAFVSKQVMHARQSCVAYFWYIRGYGGHTSGMNRYQAAFKFRSEAELVRMLGKLGIRIGKMPKGAPRPILGKSYAFDDFSKMFLRSF